jgi:hypothetical protein
MIPRLDRQTPLYLPHIDVPSDAIYQQGRSAVATKGFHAVSGTPFPTAEINTHDARGQAQLRPPALDTVSTVKPEFEEDLSRLMWQQCEELSDLDSDIWDYCNWNWLRAANTASDM